jgi:retron-type reverse transcriptase
LNKILNKKQSKPKISNLFVCDNTEVTDPAVIANKCCQYFSSIGPNLAKKVPNTLGSPLKYLNENFPHSVFFSPASKDEIVNIVRSFKSDSAAGHDNIPTNIIKQSIDLIAEPLTHIINLSINNGIVPDQMKIARVVPIYKSNGRLQFNNYRPISVLPAFSKILERIIYNRMINYLDKYNILYHQQYGFRRGHSTSMALIQLFDKISSAIDEKKFTIRIFLDLSKAFDTVDHEILFNKLEHYGFRGTTLDWIKSYFYNRNQIVQYNHHCSDLKKICCGVPQGSILGPLFFLIYINDICNVSKTLELILFADDTNVFYSHENFEYLVNSLNDELTNCRIGSRLIN